MSEPYRLVVSARRFTTALAVVAAVLVLLHVLMWLVFFGTHLLDELQHWSSLFDLDTEASFGTWFSSAMLLVAGTFALLHAKQGGSPGQGRVWWLIGLALMAASVDEVIGLHESLNSDPRFTALMGHWTVPAAVLSVVAALALLPFLRRLPARTRTLLILSGVVYVGGAVGVEFATIGYESADALNTLGYNLWNAVEEGLEMAGIILFLHALLGHMAREDGKVEAQVRVRRGKGGKALR